MINVVAIDLHHSALTLLVGLERRVNDLHSPAVATATPSSLVRQNPERFILLIPAT